MKIQVLSTSEERFKKFHVLDFPDQREVVIGRDADCDLHIDDSQSSRRHARIFWMGGRTFLEDMESKNGTRLNGQSIRRVALANNDQIQIGSTVLTVAGVPSDARDTASVHFDDESCPVLVALNQDEAKMLSPKKGAPLEPPGADREKAALQQLCRISERVASSHDADKTICEVLDDVRILLSADTACLLMQDPSTATWQVVLSSQRAGLPGAITMSRTIISQALREGQAILSAHPMLDSRFGPSQSILSHGVSSAVCAPIRVEKRFGGVLFLDRRKCANAFDETDLRIVAAVAGMVKLLLDRERLTMEARQTAAPG